MVSIFLLLLDLFKQYINLVHFLFRVFMQNNVLLGICLMVVTTFMFSAMDGVSRFLAERNNIFTLVTMRYWFIAIITIISCLFTYNSIIK